MKGDLVLDRSHFVQPTLPVFDDDGNDKNKPFLVGPDALLVNLKALRFIARNDGGNVKVLVEPPIATVQIDNRIQALPKAKCPGWPDIRYNPIDNGKGVTVVVTGKLPAGCSGQTYLSVLDHQRYAAGAVRVLRHVPRAGTALHRGPRRARAQPALHRERAPARARDAARGGRALARRARRAPFPSL